MLLINGIKLAEISTPPPNSDDKIFMILRVSLGFEQAVAVNGIEL